MGSRFVVKLVLGIQAIEPMHTMHPGGEQTKIISAGEMNFFGEHREPAAAISMALANMMGYAERLYGPIMIVQEDKQAKGPKLITPTGQTIGAPVDG